MNATLPPKATSVKRLAVLMAVLAGILLGVGGYTFNYAEGLSYFSTDPAACANCHIMQPQYDAWQKASHHTVASCVDCHLPQSFIPKYIAKAENGYHHSKGFTFQDFHEPIMVKPKNIQILHDNCIRCHQDLVHEVTPISVSDPNFLRCTQCHSTVGHGERVGLGGAEKPYETRMRNHP